MNRVLITLVSGICALITFACLIFLIIVVQDINAIYADVIHDVEEFQVSCFCVLDFVKCFVLFKFLDIIIYCAYIMVRSYE
ncbi:hypothetical protein Y032_0113g395 [Ancylostoma ceylanicum]|uniref:Nematode cuticle collagen N-terminal domain-containing protein n=1 Tax=Ancylostoma ceylanicum TaxID=53326 RepID=A0A016TCS2_9BILA|nr:hypothetical protein Y032_0113g395 [Ancylostoma ceylanicum]